MTYRAEIDGLRALAVMPVLLFHAGLPGFTGGFVGVDVFFVISGYLISGIIWADLQAGRFSLWRFYERRARRILPALLPVIAVSSVLAYLWMLPDDLQNFGQSVVATLAFSNNVLLTLTSGYWDLAAEFKPLLHSWSLGLEEQFYIAYPLTLMLIVRWAPQALTGVLLTGIAVSLSISLLLSGPFPVASFYLPHTRVWELLLGALASRLSGARPCGSLALFGLAMILGAVLFLDGDIAYPGALALLPALGTVSVLIWGGQGTLAARLLSLPPLRGLGLISYSAYLWHQPVFAFMRIRALEEPRPVAMLAGLALILPLAWASWRFIEQPFRNPGRMPRALLIPALTLPSVALIAAGLILHLSAGAPGRAPGLSSGNFIAYNERIRDLDHPAFSRDMRPKLIVLGNSTARDFVNVMLESGRFTGFDILYRDDARFCAPLGPGRTAALVARADAVIVATGWALTQDCSRTVLADLGPGAKPLAVIGPKHFGYNLNPYLHLPLEERVRARAVLLARTPGDNLAFRAKVPAGHYLDQLGLAQARMGGVPVFDAAGEILSGDRIHLTPAGARAFAGFVFEDPLWAPFWELTASR